MLRGGRIPYLIKRPTLLNKERVFQEGLGKEGKAEEGWQQCQGLHVIGFCEGKKTRTFVLRGRRVEGGRIFFSEKGPIQGKGEGPVYSYIFTEGRLEEGKGSLYSREKKSPHFSGPFGRNATPCRSNQRTSFIGESF